VTGEERTGMNQRARRRALNEATFREVNERIRDLNVTFSEFTGEFSIVCECDDSACVEHLAMRPEEYEAIRRDSTLFAVIPGHESPAVETVEVERGGYSVVRKKPGEPAEIAAATDPRSD
jgi:hypothetical protein